MPAGAPARRPTGHLPYFVFEVDETGLARGRRRILRFVRHGLSGERLRRKLKPKAQSGVLRAWGLRFRRAETPHGKYILCLPICRTRAQHIKRPSAHLPAHFAGGGLAFFLAISMLWHLAVRPVEEAGTAKQFGPGRRLARAENAADGSAGQCRADVRRGQHPMRAAGAGAAAPWRPRGGCAAWWKLPERHGPTAACWSPRAPGWIGPRKRTRRFVFEPLFRFEKGLVLDTRLMRAFLCAATLLSLQQLAAICWTTRANILLPGTVVRG